MLKSLTMKLSRLLLSVVVALLVFVTFLSQSALATAKQKPPPPPPDMRKIIVKVDVKSNTVTIIYANEHMTHDYKIDDMTKLKVNNQDGKFADIKRGMVVDDYIERDNDYLDLLSLSGYGTTKSAAKPKTAAKPAPKPPAATTTPPADSTP
jgi:hypothetical protein